MSPEAIDAYEPFALAAMDVLRGLLPAELHALDQADLLLELREDLRHLAARVVREAREGGATWQAVGDHYGVSRQAAQQRFGGI